MAADVYERIVAAAAAKLAGVRVGGVGRDVVTQRRLKPAALPSLPCVVLTYFDEFDQHYGGDWAADEVGYPVLVEYVQNEQAAGTAANAGDELTWRLAISDALRFQRLAGVSEVTTCVPEPRAVAASGAPDAADQLQASGVLYRFVVRQARGAA